MRISAKQAEISGHTFPAKMLPPVGLVHPNSNDHAVLHFSKGDNMGTTERAADFLNAIGINVHMSYTNTSYSNATNVISDLQYLGVDHVRDGDLGTLINNPTFYNPYAKVAAAGIKFDLILPASQTLANDLYFLNTLEAAVPGSVSAVEGPNEITSSTVFFTGGTGVAALPAVEQAIYNAVTGDAALAGIPIYANSFLPPALAASVSGNLSPYVTDGNAHIYFNENQPQANLMALAQSTVDVPDDPKVVTETGYATQPGIDPASGTMNVNDDVQAKFTLDLLFDDMKAGAQSVYLYELLDEFNDPNDTNRESHFGLFNFDGSPKPAAIALHNLTTILADNASTASTFTTGTLNYTVTGLSQYSLMFVDGQEYQNFGGSSYLLEKSNGAFDLAVWAEPSLWNDVTVSEMVAPPTLATVSLGQTYQTIEVFDPMVSSSPIQVLHNVSQVQITVTDHPVIIEVEPTGVGTNAQAISRPNVFTMMANGASTTLGDNMTLSASSISFADSASSGPLAATIYVYNSSGQVTDANGSLAGAGLVKAGVGEYAITAASPAALSAAFLGLAFTPTAHQVAVGKSVVSKFSIVLSDGTNTAIETTPNISIVAKETAPGIAGTVAGQVITDAQVLKPFANTVVTEPDFGAKVSTTITLVNGGNSVTDADGSLSGTGLTKTGTGTYALAANTPGALTAALAQLVFTPTAGQVPAGQSVTTTFDLAVSDGTDTTKDMTNSTIVTAAAAPKMNFLAPLPSASGMGLSATLAHDLAALFGGILGMHSSNLPGSGYGGTDHHIGAGSGAGGSSMFSDMFMPNAVTILPISFHAN